MRNLASHIHKNAIEIRQGNWGNPAAGGFEKALFYFNGKHTIVTEADGTLITILRNAAGNKNFHRAALIWKK
jgi:hypothetical protein